MGYAPKHAKPASGSSTGRNRHHRPLSEDATGTGRHRANATAAAGPGQPKDLARVIPGPRPPLDDS